jgi:hypothetical protein
MIVIRSALPLLLLLGACDVDSTVGYNNASALVGPATCGTDAPLARCSDNGCAVANVFDAPHGSITLAVDDANIFFLAGPQTIGRRATDSGVSVELASADSTLIRMTSDATHVYWTELDGRVRGVPKPGGERFDAGYVFGNPSDISVDATHLYWIFPEFGQVAMVAKPSGNASHISGQDAPQAITTDATSVYWVNAGSRAASGQLVRAPRGDLASAEVWLNGLDAPVAITVSEEAVYWASKTAVVRVRKGETAVEPVAAGFTEVKAIRVFGSTLYGVGMDGLWRVAASGGDWQTLERRPMSGMAIACSGVYATGWFEDAVVRYAP